MKDSARSCCYIGIDLGTTNSAIAWGMLDIRANQFRSRMIEIDRQMDVNGRTRQHRLLPSCTYFSPRGISIIGDYAKTMLQKEPGLVAKSMKRCMDKGDHIFTGTDGVSWTPIQTSTGILSQLKNAAAPLFNLIGGFPERNVMITVPASFEKSMREATVEAACNAKFKITEKNLLYEPHAALYYFCNQPIPDHIDFKDPKLVLVFDLGGGTLDVSLHKVSKQESNLIIKDIAVSPYTRFGGDDFDKHVAEKLLENYKYPEELDASEMNLLKFQFQAYAENTKIKLSESIKVARATNPVFEIREQPTLPEHSNLPFFEYDLSWCKYEEIIEPFLASDLKLESDPYASGSNNIIDPILNVLAEGKKELNCFERPTVDVVLLNGGMTKLPLIQQRLEDFFGTGVVRYESNPDEAVALGAVFYQAR